MTRCLVYGTKEGEISGSVLKRRIDFINLDLTRLLIQTGGRGDAEVE